MLEVHHLGRSQSERVVWLCEELGIDYKLHIHERNPDTALTPPALAEVHPAGTAPVIVDTTPGGKRVVIGESGACLEYIANVYGNGRFQVKPGAENYGDYLQWYHFCNGSYQPGQMRQLMLEIATGGSQSDNPVTSKMKQRQDLYRQMLDDRLGESPYLGGDELTLADFITVYSLTTNRGFRPLDLSPHKNILAYLQRIAQREGYKRSRAKGDPNTPPLLAPTVERFKFGALK